MDDGLQNGSLAKDLVIAVVDGRRGIGNGRVIPAGPLRAPLAFQLGLVDAFVVNEVDGAGVGDSPFVAGLRSSFAGPVMAAVTRPLGDTAWLSDHPILAFCGIGAPGRFFGLLRRLGAPLVGERVYADHHALSEREARALLAEARLAGALLVTTEKDWVRLADRGAPGELKQAARTLPIHLELGERDGLRLRGLIEGSLARLGAGGP
jgi:tetraacyldisaccharide 4'-kinase